MKNINAEFILEQIQSILKKETTTKLKTSSFEDLSENFENKEYLIIEITTSLPFNTYNYYDFDFYGLKVKDLKIWLQTSLVTVERIVVEEILKQQLKEKKAIIYPTYANRLRFYYLITRIEKTN